MCRLVKRETKLVEEQWRYLFTLALVLCHFQTGSNHIVMAIIDRWVALRHKGVKVEMVWVRAHAGIEGNSRVDWFAKKATQLGEPLEVKIPYSDVIGTYKQKAIANWQKIYL
ncbi:hypothetical protein O3M35_008104 [Rhynocoris fuscipes]|uniref:RNase H type-1 domain-containing protein n=1 Tax=Rhynocoris fuscipes TaxID=488301 RepID=A0AAW1D7S7_9HEMI